MDFLEKIDMLMARTGDNKSTLAKRSGIPYTTIDGFYKKGYENVKLSTLQRLCDYFGVSLDYLVRDAHVSVLAPDEHALLDGYRKLNPDGRRLLLTTAESYAANPSLTQDTSGKAI